MKKLIAIILMILTLSCNDTTSNNVQSIPSEENWEISRRTTSLNTYSLSGLLDTTYKTTYVYQNSMLIDSLQSIITRKYNDSNLVNQKEFVYLKDGKATLSNEVVKTYNTKGHLLSEVMMVNNDLFSKTTNEYNPNGQVERKIIITQIMQPLPTFDNIDSAIAHHNDKKTLQFDTVVYTYNYDASGNKIRSSISDARGNVRKFSVNQYNGKEKTLSFETNANGDTLATFTYKPDGNLIREVANIKNTAVTDTVWLYNGKEVKVIGSNGAIKHKETIKYNEKGDEVENTLFK